MCRKIQGETLRFKGNKTNWFPKGAVIKCCYVSYSKDSSMFFEESVFALQII